MGTPKRARGVQIRKTTYRLHSCDDGFQSPFVGDAVFARTKVTKLDDIGTRSKRIALAPEYHHTDRRVRVNAIACLDEGVVHGPRQRVARLRPIEGQRGNRASDVELRFSHEQE
jgi:hypothetical protein